MLRETSTNFEVLSVGRTERCLPFMVKATPSLAWPLDLALANGDIVVDILHEDVSCASLVA
jgi:hypothetical protein